MDRIIEVKVGGNYISKDNKNAGVKGEANVTNLRISFDEGWDEYAKTVTFWDAYGNNPVKRIQGIDLLEDITKDTRTYITPIPAEPLAIAGELTFVIDGYLDGKRQRSISDKLVVKESPVTDNAGEPSDPTPTQAEQLQMQIDKFKIDVQKAVIARDETKVYRDEAEEFSQTAEMSKDIAESAVNTAETHATRAESFASEAESFASESERYSATSESFATQSNLAANRAETATTRNPIIVDGYWHVWSATDEKYIDTGVKAQSGSEVYIGANPPDTADVIIDLDGESALYAPYIGDNGYWYTFNPDTQTFTDSGVRALAQDGYTPRKGVDYFDGSNGDDGISCTHSWNGTILTVKSASGESSANLKGERGDTYILTDEDKINIANEAAVEIEAELNEALDEIIAIQEELMTPDGNGVAY